MEIVYEKTLKNDIKHSALSPVYVLFGEDSYLKKHYCDQIIKEVCGEDTDFNLQVFEQSANMQNVYEAVNQFPLMAEKRCVALNDYDFEHAEKAEFDRLCEILADVPSTTVFVLRFDSVQFDTKKSSRVKKIIASTEIGGGKIVSLSHRDESDLLSMICRGAKQRGCQISNTNARYMITVCGDDINTLINELNKLCLFVSSGEITEQTINTVCSKTVEASVYDYVRAIISLNVSKALSLLDDMFFMRIEPMAIMYSVYSCYVDMYRLYCAGRSGVARDEIIADFGYGKKSFVLNNASANLKKFTIDKLSKSLDLLVKTDKEIKSFSSDEKQILQELTVKLARIITAEDKS